MGCRQDIYNYIKENGLRTYSNEELRTVGKISSWARVVRQLRQDEVLIYNNNNDNSYTVEEINDYKSSTTRIGLGSNDKYRIRNRDGHRCQSCGRSPSDGVKLHVDHKIPVDFGGTNLDENLWTLCDDCNQGKKNFYKDDFDSEVMTEVFKKNSGYQKLKILFELSPNKKFSPSIIQGISGIRDWTRTIRKIRDEENINIVWFPATKEDPNGYYSNVL